MVRWVFAFIALVVAGSACPSRARAQAAAEYGMAASKSAAIATRARPLATSRATPLSKRIAGRTSPTFVDVIQQNREKLEAKSGPSGGSLRVDSIPSKAKVSVDGAPVAYTPADLKLPEGNHVVELALPGFLPWRKDITVSREGNMLLKAELRNQYKSSVTFSRFK